MLDTLINRSLIIDHCRSQNINVSQKDIQDEIDRLAKKFQLPTDQYLKLLEKERGVKPEAICWRRCVADVASACRLAAAQLVKGRRRNWTRPTKAEASGPAVKVRLIVLTEPKQAREVHALVVAKPDEFGALARKHSQDRSSRKCQRLDPCRSAAI